jgi:hypothetical protein
MWLETEANAFLRASKFKTNLSDSKSLTGVKRI